MAWFDREVGVVQINPNLTPIEYLLARMRDPRTEEGVRTRIAIALLPFTTPKLAVTAMVDGRDFGEKLEKAIVRSQTMKVNGRSVQIETKVSSPDSDLEGL